MRVVDLIREARRLNLGFVARELSRLAGVTTSLESGRLKVRLAKPEGVFWIKEISDGVMLYQPSEEFGSTKLARILLEEARKLGWEVCVESRFCLKNSHGAVYPLIKRVLSRDSRR